MAESIVSDWLTDYAALEPTEIRTFAAQHENNHEISSALFTIINERLKYPDVLHSICDQLFSYYRSNEPELKHFTLQFVPTLIYTYLNAVAQGDKKSCRSVETLLLGMYNIEVSTDDGQPKVVSFRMPVLAQASIYHEEKSLNSYDLRRWEENSNKDVNWGPLPQVESVNAQNRLKIMTAVMFVYNQQLSAIPKSALYHLCRVASQLVNQGFTKYGHAHRPSYGTDPNSSMVTPKPMPRIPMATQFLLELLNATYFAMFNEFASIAIQTVDDIHNRACFELYTEVILVTNAIKNSLHANPSGQPCDGPMGLSVALTPTTHTVTVSKSMITNASFRTKKLPDDLEMDYVAALEAQQIHSARNEMIAAGNGMTTANENGLINFVDGLASNTLSGSPKEMRKCDSKKRWKNWGWKYSPGGKTSSIEEEPTEPASVKSSRQSSPNSSPKHKNKLSTTDVAAAAVANFLSQSPLRRRTQSNQPQSLVNGMADATSPASTTTRSDIRSSAGARLCQTFEDLQNESGDELQALLINGRPASVHIVPMSSTLFNNDIPIQAGDESLAGNNLNQLVSITEETDANGTTAVAVVVEPSLGMRNNLVRSSKEILKTHKVPFPGFKKLKDKDKDKEKEKEKERDAAGSGGSGGGMVGGVNQSNSANKMQSSKNGNILTDGVKESAIIAATKQLTRKEKKNSTTVQAASVDTMDTSYHEKTSPLLQIKRKSSSIDVTCNGPVTNIDMVQLPSYANGNSIILEEKQTTKVGIGGGDYSIIIDGKGSAETSPDVSIITQRTLIVVDHNNSNSKPTANINMQISQV